MNEAVLIITFISALGSALVGGAFFAFSSFVMQALGRLPTAEGARAMQEINRLAVTPVFMTALFGTGLVCLVTAVLAILCHVPGCVWIFAGAVLYIVSNPIVTMVLNVPLNNALDRVDAASPEAAAVWGNYLKAWTRWNTVRAIGGVAAAGMLVAGLLTS
jgi:uncharacterized membrane protein